MNGNVSPHAEFHVASVGVVEAKTLQTPLCNVVATNTAAAPMSPGVVTFERVAMAAHIANLPAEHPQAVAVRLALPANDATALPEGWSHAIGAHVPGKDAHTFTVDHVFAHPDFATQTVQLTLDHTTTSANVVAEASMDAHIAAYGPIEETAWSVNASHTTFASGNTSSVEIHEGVSHTTIRTPTGALIAAIRNPEAADVKAVVITGAGGNFCSGGDVHEIIGPLTKMSMPEMLEFTRMTGDLVKTMRLCPQPIIAAIDGICAGAGAMMALAADMRLGTAQAKTAFLFTRVGLAGADMGACALLPRLIGQGRASELLFTGRAMTAQEGLQWGFFNSLHEPDAVLGAAQKLAADLASGPTFAHGMTKTMLHQEWAMTLDQAIEAEAQAQAICMQTKDFTRAYEAFAAKQKPAFMGD